MKELLIIRSAGFQQLDMNMKVIEDKYKDYHIHMLTHEHGVKLAKKYKSIKNVYIYPYKEGFQFKNKVTELKNKTFDVVMIPVTNISGVGFLNVLFFSLSLKTKRRVICNLVSDIWGISTTEIIVLGIKNLLISCLSTILTFFSSILLVVILPILLKTLKKK